MKIYKIAQTIDYPLAGSEVSGLYVEDDVPNTSSIGASLENYEILEGIREIPLSAFHLTGRSYSVSECKRIENLAQTIKNNGWVKPIIVVIDGEGPYILEGVHRAEALFLLGVTSLPAMVVIDEDI